MSKKVELIISIDPTGKIIVTPKGTIGKECLELMEFLDKIKDFKVISTIENSDMNLNEKIIIKENIKDIHKN
jgi:hypothetical protein